MKPRNGVIIEYVRILIEEDWKTKAIAVLFLLTAGFAVWMWFWLMSILLSMLA